MGAFKHLVCRGRACAARRRRRNGVRS